jgi:hypothetical protein
MKDNIIEAIRKLAFYKGRELENDEESEKMIDEIIELLKKESKKDKCIMYWDAATDRFNCTILNEIRHQEIENCFQCTQGKEHAHNGDKK